MELPLKDCQIKRHVDSRQCRQLFCNSPVHSASSSPIVALKMMQADRGLDQHLVKDLLFAAGLEPDFFPDFMCFKVVSRVELDHSFQILPGIEAPESRMQGTRHFANNLGRGRIRKVYCFIRSCRFERNFSYENEWAGLDPVARLQFCPRDTIAVDERAIAAGIVDDQDFAAGELQKKMHARHGRMPQHIVARTMPSKTQPELRTKRF